MFVQQFNIASKVIAKNIIQYRLWLHNWLTQVIPTDKQLNLNNTTTDTLSSIFDNIRLYCRQFSPLLSNFIVFGIYGKIRDSLIFIPNANVIISLIVFESSTFFYEGVKKKMGVSCPGLNLKKGSTRRLPTSAKTHREIQSKPLSLKSLQLTAINLFQASRTRTNPSA